MKILRKVCSPFFCVSLIISLFFFFINYSHDDARRYGVYLENFTIYDLWMDCYKAYFVWSPRTLVDFVGRLILFSNRIVFVLYVFFSYYVLQNALYRLFSPAKNEKALILFITTLTSLIPLVMFSSTGWVATFSTYFGPSAFGLMSLVPIKKVISGERISSWEFVFYACCLVYGSNIEQMAMLTFASYLFCFISLLYKRLFDIQFISLFVLSLCSFAYSVFCPGLKNRYIVERDAHFHNFPMLDFYDQLDIGMSRTLHWLFFGQDVLAIVAIILLMFTLFIWIRYDDHFYRFFSLIPVVLVLSLGIFKPITFSLFPFLSKIVSGVPEYGFFAVQTMGWGGNVIQFFLLLFLVICIFLELVLLTYHIKDLLIDCVLLGVGFISSVMIGFSPSVFASSNRTFSILLFCIIAVSVHIFVTNTDKIDFKGKPLTIFNYAMYSLIFLGILQSFCATALIFH